MESAHFYPRSNGYRNDAERLCFVIRASGLTKMQFARQIGLRDNEWIHRIQYFKAPLTPELVQLIHNQYPQIDSGWLLSGIVGHRTEHGPTETYPPHE